VTAGGDTLAVVSERTAGEQVFEAYLQQRGIPVPAHEPDLGVRTRPDYLLALGEDSCLCEIKQFAPDTNSIPGSGSWPMTTVLKPIRSKVHEGARQLRPAAELGRPLVVVLTNPLRAPVILGDREFIWALEGDPIVQVPVGRYGSGAPVHTVGRNGELRHDHPYLTAVALVYEHAYEPGVYSATVFVPGSEQAPPLPEVFFRGPTDRVLAYSFERQAYVTVHEPAAAV
jgi:hypothetical protein